MLASTRTRFGFVVQVILCVIILAYFAGDYVFVNANLGGGCYAVVGACFAVVRTALHCTALHCTVTRLAQTTIRRRGQRMPVHVFGLASRRSRFRLSQVRLSQPGLQVADVAKTVTLEERHALFAVVKT